MPHIIPQTQTEDDLLQREHIQRDMSRIGLKWNYTAKVKKAVLGLKRTSDIKHKIEERSFLVTVRSHQRAMPRSSKKKMAKKNSEAYIARTCKMDVASFREISRIQKLENKKMKANVVGQVQRKRALDEWKDFWSRAVISGRKKRKKTITVAKSRELKEKELIAWEKNEIKKVSQKVNADDRLLASPLLDDVHARMEWPQF